jgi:hypothetical protein
MPIAIAIVSFAMEATRRKPLAILRAYVLVVLHFAQLARKALLLVLLTPYNGGAVEEIAHGILFGDGWPRRRLLSMRKFD